jgi:Fe-S cluster biosynthesis and repair protein YggX
MGAGGVSEIDRITCARCGQKTAPMAAAPLVGSRGEKVRRNICPACWQAWVDQSALLINHYGIQVADPAQRQRLYAVMADFLKLDTL